MWLNKKKPRKKKQLFNHGCINFAGYNLSQGETVNWSLNLAGLGRKKNLWQLGSLSILDDNDNIRKLLVSCQQNNSTASALHFLVHFFNVHCNTRMWNLLSHFLGGSK